MRRIEELSSDYTTSEDFGTQVEKWREQLIDEARAKRRFEQVTSVFRPEQPVHSYKVPIANVVDFEPVTETEHEEVDFTTLDDSIEHAIFVPTYKRSAVAVSQEALEENVIDAIDYARDQLTEFASTKVDFDIRNELEGADPDNIAGGEVIYPEDVDDVSDMTTDSTLSTSMIAQGVRYLREENWYNTDEQPYVMFIHPAQEHTLLTEKQFVDASEYGSDDVVLNGEIGRYLGIRVISTSQVKTYEGGDEDTTTGDTWDGVEEGGSVYLFKAERPVGICWGREAVLQAEERPEFNHERIYLGMKYDTELLQESALVIMKAAHEATGDYTD